MSTRFRLLGQARPVIGFRGLYSVANDLGSTISTLAITNVTDLVSEATVWLFNPETEVPSSVNTLLNNVRVLPKSTLTLTIGITLEEGKAINVASSESGALVFNAFGSESLSS
jgi:hypothetical protein